MSYIDDERDLSSEYEETLSATVLDIIESSAEMEVDELLKIIHLNGQS
jgi:hypothetical protein